MASREQPVLLQPLIERFGLQIVHEAWLREIGTPATLLPTMQEVLQVFSVLEQQSQKGS